jgi:hypothetical protein
LPNFIGDITDAFLQLIDDVHQLWDGTPISTRLLGALLLAGFGVYLGSRSERSAISAVFFFAAFGFFAYVMAVGITLVH